MKSSILGTLAAVAVLAAAGAGYWYGQQRPEAGAQAGPGPAPAPPGGAPKGGPGGPGGNAVTVEARKVALATMPQAITAVGSLRSDESITVRPEVAGRIAVIGFQEGQRVAKGATLVKLDPAINAAEVEQARANLKLAQSKFDRAVDLAKSNFISGQARDEAENNLRVAQASLQLAEARLARMEIKAPFSGIVGLRSVSLGDYVKEGADIVNLESIDTLKVDFRVPEVYLRQVSVGQTLAVTLDAFPGRTYEGRVIAVNPLIDAAGRSVVIRAQVRNSDTALRPGMFARVRLFTREATESMVVPDTALLPSGDEQYVFKVVEGKVQRVRIDIGQRREGMVEVLQGIGRDDVIVTAGHQKIREGSQVRVAGAENGAAGTAAKANGVPAKNGNSAVPKS